MNWLGLTEMARKRTQIFLQFVNIYIHAIYRRLNGLHKIPLLDSNVKPIKFHRACGQCFTRFLWKIFRVMHGRCAKVVQCHLYILVCSITLVLGGPVILLSGSPVESQSQHLYAFGVVFSFSSVLKSLFLLISAR